MQDIRHRFTNHPPTGKIGRIPTGEVLDRITVAMIRMGEFLDDVLPEGREKSLAITKLEESSMWSKAAVARNQEG